MVNKQTVCDPDRIELFLQQKLSDDEQTAFEQHLDDCHACRRHLETAVAGDDVWSAVRNSLRDERFSPRLPGEGGHHVPMVGVRAADDAAIESNSAEETFSSQATVLKLLAPTDDDRMLGRWGTYEVVGVVGAGGMGVVLKALDAALNRYVAIKILAPHLGSSGAARKRFSREAQASAAVVHDNVIEIYGVAEAAGLPYLVMPYVRGPSLQRRLDNDGPLAVVEILRVGMQAAAGLAAAHAQGLVHRDVKPGNILLADGIERVKLTDFGLARAADDASLTKTGIIAGTPQYMSPEQARGEPVDQRSDVFSLGSVLYAMCTGRPPFRAETSYGVLRRITDDEPRPIREINPDIPDWLCCIVEKLMAKRPDDRFQTASEVSALLEQCLAHVQQPTVVPLPSVLISLRRDECITTERDEYDPAGHDSNTNPKRQRGFGRSILAYASGWYDRKPLFTGTLAMLSLIGVTLFAAGVASTNPPDISGNWQGEDWGQVTLKQTAPGEYTGTYTDTVVKEKGPGKIDVKWSRIERRYSGAWREGDDDRFGELSIHMVDKEIRGALTTSASSKINPATPRLAELVWRRTSPAESNAVVAPDDPWGDWSVSWSVRLRAAKRVIPAGELPEFTVDLRKRKEAEPDAVRQSLEQWLVEVDKRQYRPRCYTTSWESKQVLEPGTTRQDFISFHFQQEEGGLVIRTGKTSQWINSYSLGNDFHLAPGKHTLRVAFPASSNGRDYAFSNSVEIELQGTEPEKVSGTVSKSSSDTSSSRSSISTQEAIGRVSKALAPILQRLDPKPTVKSADGSLEIGYRTTTYGIHRFSNKADGNSKEAVPEIDPDTGAQRTVKEVAAETVQEIGPETEGFILRVRSEPRGTPHQAETPQTIREPSWSFPDSYWSTDVDITPIDGTDKQIYWRLSYGRGAPSDILRDIRAALRGMQNVGPPRNVLRFSQRSNKSYVRIPTSESLNSLTNGGNTQLTLAMWVYPTEEMGNSGILYKGRLDWSQGAFQVSFAHGTGAPNKLKFRLNGVLDKPGDLTSETHIATNRWTFIVCTYDGEQQRIYIDGNLDVSAPCRGPLQSDGSDVFIGVYQSTTYIFDGHYLCFNGSIADVGIWQKALDTTAISSLYQAGAGGLQPTSRKLGLKRLAAGYALDEGRGRTVADFSGNENTGTLEPDAVWAKGEKGPATTLESTSGDSSSRSSISSQQALVRVSKVLAPILRRLDIKPPADFSDGSTSFQVSQGTRMYTVHRQNKDGSTDETVKEIGPDVRGFILRVTVEPLDAPLHPFDGPSTLHEANWSTDIDMAPINGTDKRFYWFLSYGAETPADLLREIPAALRSLQNAQGAHPRPLPHPPATERTAVPIRTSRRLPP